MAQLVLVAGPNGSGKTTLVRSGILADRLAPGIQLINADDIALDLAAGALPTQEQSLHAAQLGDDALDAAITARRSVLMETVLSSDKLKRRVMNAKHVGYSVTLIYITVASGALNIARVQQRHAQGGHTIPAELILARRERSHALFGWFAREADTVLIYDNSGFGRPTYQAGKTAGKWELQTGAHLPLELAEAIKTMMG